MGLDPWVQVHAATCAACSLLGGIPVIPVIPVLLRACASELQPVEPLTSELPPCWPYKKSVYIAGAVASVVSLLFDLGDEVQLDSSRWDTENASCRLLLVLAVIIFKVNLDISVIPNASSQGRLNDTRIFRSSNLVHFAGCRSRQRDFRVNVSRTLPRAFAKSLGRAGKWRIQAVEMPVQVTEIAISYLTVTQSGLATMVAEDNVVLVILEPQRISRHIVAIPCSNVWLDLNRRRPTSKRAARAYFALDGALASSYSPSSPRTTSS